MSKIKNNEITHTSNTGSSNIVLGSSGEVTPSKLKIGSDAQGDVMYYNGTQYVRLAKGTAGQVLKMNSGATAPEWSTDLGGVVKKIHAFEFSTRTAGTSANDSNQFTWTTAFTPLDPDNNSFICDFVIPSNTRDNYWAGFGLRFQDTSGGGNIVDVVGKGQGFKAQTGSAANKMSFYTGTFNVAASTINDATQTVFFHMEEAAGHAEFYCPNTTDSSDIGMQTTAQLIITEYKN